jgi:hypothetical protein
MHGTHIRQPGATACVDETACVVDMEGECYRRTAAAKRGFFLGLS